MQDKKYKIVDRSKIVGMGTVYSSMIPEKRNKTKQSPGEKKKKKKTNMDIEINRKPENGN